MNKTFLTLLCFFSCNTLLCPSKQRDPALLEKLQRRRDGFRHKTEDGLEAKKVYQYLFGNIDLKQTSNTRIIQAQSVANELQRNP